MRRVSLLMMSFLCGSALHAFAQSSLNLIALRGLSPVATLLATPEGRAALASNLDVTSGIQTGRIEQPLLLPLSDQRQLALRDAFITDGNAAELSDGLGTKLAEAYARGARYTDAHNFTNAVQSVADLIAYTNNVTKADSNSGKYFFANQTLNGTTPVSDAARAILEQAHGTTDVFGKAYDRPAGSLGADAFGNSRPFQTSPTLLTYRGRDYFGHITNSADWLWGPAQPLVNSPSFPSGHTTYGYTQSLLLALLVPARYQQMIVRGAEYGNDRIVLGAHYAMDVLGGRTLALHDVAHLLANDPAYIGRPRSNPAVDPGTQQPASRTIDVTDFRALVGQARADLTAFLEARCGAAIATCAKDDGGRFKDNGANAAFYAATQTYGLSSTRSEATSVPVDVATVAPEAGYLLVGAFPKLTLSEANAILTKTLGPAGGFLDDGASFGVYSRLNLYAAGGEAAAITADRR